MARHNMVIQFAHVLGDPIIIRDDKTGEFKQGVCKVVTIRNTRNDDEDVCKFDEPLIFTNDPAMVQEMELWKQNDIVHIKGALTTKDIKKKTTCPHCGGKNSKDGVLNCISPIYIGVMKTGLTKNQSIAILKSMKEISNQALMIGQVVGNVSYYHPEATNFHNSYYQLAINRKYYLKGDVAGERTDFPFVRTFGQQAKLDHTCLYQASSIMVDGFLATKKYNKETVCEHCGEHYDWTDHSMEIVGYSVEYLKDFKTPEQIKQEEDDKVADLKAKLGLLPPT